MLSASDSLNTKASLSSFQAGGLVYFLPSYASGAVPKYDWYTIWNLPEATALSEDVVSEVSNSNCEAVPSGVYVPALILFAVCSREEI